MIFLGDIAIPNSKSIGVKIPNSIKKQIAIANLEGAIVAEESFNYKKEKLYNGDKVLSYLKKLNIKVVSLANNHITDIPEEYENTIDLLRTNSIQFCGAGYTYEEASKPAVLYEDSIQYAFLAFGWRAIGCKKVKKGRVGINALTHANVLKCIRRTQKDYPNAKIILLFHWNYELEFYPQPMHRELAKEAIDLGVSAVIGHHPHCMQKVEMYKNRPIVYSLGNCLIPSGYFMNGNLDYPRFCDRELLCHIEKEYVDFQILKYDRDKDILSWLGPISIKDISAPFTGYDAKTYLYWFKKNRKKRLLLPIFDKESQIGNEIKYLWIDLRAIGIGILVKLRIKNGLRDGG